MITNPYLPPVNIKVVFNIIAHLSKTIKNRCLVKRVYNNNSIEFERDKNHKVCIFTCATFWMATVYSMYYCECATRKAATILSSGRHRRCSSENRTHSGFFDWQRQSLKKSGFAVCGSGLLVSDVRQQSGGASIEVLPFCCCGERTERGSGVVLPTSDQGDALGGGEATRRAPAGCGAPRASVRGTAERAGAERKRDGAYGRRAWRRCQTASAPGTDVCADRG